MTATAINTDIIIVGAGLVGTSLALALSHQGIRVHVLEHQLPTVASKQSHDTRPLTLSYGSQCILQTLKVWDALSDKACPITTVHVSDRGAFGALHFRAAELQVPALGYVVPFDDLRQTLYHQALAEDHVTVMAIDQIETIKCDDSGALVIVNTPEGQCRLTAALLVAADGTHSTVRDLLAIAISHQDRGKCALTASLDCERGDHHTAYERFTEDGTLAVLPLFQPQQYRLVWSMTNVVADKVATWDDQKLLTYTQRCFRNRLPTITAIKRGKSYPLQTIMAKEQVRPGLVLLGNAAHTLYPIAAQGFNLGLRDVAVLSEVLVDARHHQQALGDSAILQRYLDWRKGDQDRVAGLTRGISHTFGLQVPLLNRARGFGLLATEILSPIKKRFAKRTMGLAGRLPKLARGITLIE